MAMEGLLAWFCASMVAAAGPAAAPSVNNPKDSAITAALAVQTALEQGREHLLHNNPKVAIDVLERQLHLINGNRYYLAVLGQAYQAYIKELRLKNQEAAARVYIERLRILDQGVASPVGDRGAQSHTASGPAMTAPQSFTQSPPAKTPAASATPAPKPTIVRGYREESESPARYLGAEKQKTASAFLARAEQQFSDHNYRAAGLLYEQAHRADLALTDACRQRWAYCKLYQVVEQLNQHSPAYAAMAAEVRSALELAPRLDYGKVLLAEIDKRRANLVVPTPKNAEPKETEIIVRHLGTNADGWQVAETTNFRIFHTQPRKIAEQAARIAEQTRRQMQQKWFGKEGPAWNPKCDLYLHANGQDYHHVTSAPSNSPGYSTYQFLGGRMVASRIDLHCDDPNMLTAVLPHETTHTVIAGNFGGQPVPHWADEGMAVLSEPPDKIKRYCCKLPRYQQNRELFSMRRLLQMSQYPDAHYVGPFYAESVSVVDFLTRQKGPQVFAQFVRDGLKDGYEAALKRHYGFRDFDELERQWVQFAFRDSLATQTVAQGNR